MKTITFEEHQEILKKMYDSFYDSMKKLDINIYACGATIASAILINDVFDYDDDIDVMLLNSDFKEIKEIKEIINNKYELINPALNNPSVKNAYFDRIDIPIMKLRTKETYLLKYKNKEIIWKPFIDISPLYSSNKKIKFLTFIWVRSFLTEWISIYSFKSPIYKNKYLYLFIRMILPLTFMRWISNKAIFGKKKNSKKKDKYFGPLFDWKTWRGGGIWDNNFEEVDFINRKILLPKNYQEILKAKYGYLPKVNKDESPKHLDEIYQKYDKWKRIK